MASFTDIVNCMSPKFKSAYLANLNLQTKSPGIFGTADLKIMGKYIEGFDCGNPRGWPEYNSFELQLPDGHWSLSAEGKPLGVTVEINNQSCSIQVEDEN